MEVELDKKKINSLFQPEILQQIKQRRFSGRMVIIWSMGEIEHLDLSSNFRYSRMRRRRFDPDFFG